MVCELTGILMHWHTIAQPATYMQEVILKILVASKHRELQCGMAHNGFPWQEAFREGTYRAFVLLTAMCMRVAVLKMREVWPLKTLPVGMVLNGTPLELHLSHITQL